MKFNTITKQSSDEAIDNIEFDKCKLSLRSPNTPKSQIGEMELNNDDKENVDKNENYSDKENSNETSEAIINTNNNLESFNSIQSSIKDSSAVTPDIVRGMDTNYSEEETANHKVKLEHLQLRQKLMEEQNKKRKEMLARALADRYICLYIFFN